MQDHKSHTGWLTALGKEELELVKSLGWEHPDVLEAQHRFRDAYNYVKSLRAIYRQPSAERTDG